MSLELKSHLYLKIVKPFSSCSWVKAVGQALRAFRSMSGSAKVHRVNEMFFTGAHFM